MPGLMSNDANRRQMKDMKHSKMLEYPMLLAQTPGRLHATFVHGPSFVEYALASSSDAPPNVQWTNELDLGLEIDWRFESECISHALAIF